MRSVRKRGAAEASGAYVPLLAWGEAAWRHKIGHGVRPSCTAGDRDEVAFRGSGPIPLPISAPAPSRPDVPPPRDRASAKAARIAALRHGMARLERAHLGQPNCL